MTHPTPPMDSLVTPTLPTIHSNGTGAKSLEGEYRAVRLAIDDAFMMLEKATCNARDFYPQGPDAYEKARAEREQAFKYLRNVYEFVEAWEIHASEPLSY